MQISQISSSYALTDLVALGLRERRVEEAVWRCSRRTGEAAGREW
jgi:hypothetical protein